MKPVWQSLRGRLMLLVSIGTLPTLGLLLFAILQARQAVAQEVETEARRLRQLVGISQENLVEGVQSVLTTLAEVPEVRAGPDTCSSLLADLLAQTPGYIHNLLVADSAGQVVCSARTLAQAANVAGRPWFDRPLETGTFAVGEYELSPATGVPVVIFGYSLRDGLGQPIGLVAAEVSLAQLAEAATVITVPENAAILTFDRSGTVLTHYPTTVGTVGKRATDSPLVAAVLSGENAALEVAGPDGVQRLYALRPLGRGGDLGLYLAVGVSREQALAEFDQQVLRYGSVIVATVVVALGLAYLTGIQLVLRPVEILARGFRALRQGDLAVRVRMGDMQSDLGILGQDFNATAEALQTREAERREAEALLRQSERRYRTLFTHGGMCAAVLDDQGRFVEANAACAEMLGYSAAELAGLSLWDVTPEADHASSRAAWRTWTQAGEHAGAYTFRRRDGELAHVEYHAAAQVMPGHHLWMMRDVTANRRAELSNQVLAEAGRALEASLDYGALLRALLAAVVPAMADWCTAHLVAADGTAGLEAVAHADPAQLPELEGAVRQHPLAAGDASEPARVLTTGKSEFRPQLNPNGPADEAPAWLPLRTLGATGMISVPLIARGRTLGALTLALSGTARSFGWLDLALALEVGRRAALALDNARLFDEAQALNIQLEQRVAARTQQLRQSLEEVQASREALRQLSRRLQASREAERHRMAREIHDELGGALTGLKMDAVSLRQGLAPEQGALADRTKAMVGLIDATIQTVRRLATELRPSLLDDLGLVAALEWLANDFEARTGIPVRFESNVDQLDLDADSAIALYRTAQESLTNVARHAGATGVELSLAREGQRLQLLIADDGRGIAPDEINQSGSLGLMGMRERIISVAGELTIEGAPGQGTRVSVRLQLPPAPGKPDGAA